jgi:Fur family ferric uptake transcriptional regulator
MESLCDAAKVLKSSGVRVTPARVVLLEALHSRRGLFTARELHASLSAKGPDLVTVYRFLALLVRAGLAREIAGTDGVAYYEMACIHNPVHPHFECLSCGRLFCLPLFREEDAARVLGYGTGHCVESVSIVFRGTCSDCLVTDLEEGKK